MNYSSKVASVMAMVVTLLLAPWHISAQGAFGAGAAVSVYHDPQGRYTLHLPAGWATTQMNNDAVQFNSNGSFVTMLALPGSDADMTIATMSKSIGNQWKDFAAARSGDAVFAGRPAKYGTYSGSNPMGVDSYLQMLVMVDGPTTYVLLTQAAKKDFTSRKSEFDQIEQSFKLTASSTPSSPPPAPAGAGAAPIERPRSAPNSLAGTGATAVNPNQPGVYHMKLVRIVDERGFEQPMTALTLLLPVDWQFQGAVQYGQGTGCHANLVHLVFRASSPDGRLSMELLPGNVWQWTDDMNMRNMMQASNQQMARYGAHGCDIMAPMTPDEFLRRAVLPGFRRGASVVASEPLPDATERLEEEARVAQQAAARQGMHVSVRTGAGRVRVNYEVSGHSVEEWLTAMTTNIGMSGPSFNVRTGRAMYYSSSADHVFAMRAPQGELDKQDKFFRLVMGTVRVDPQWEARVQQVVANLTQQDINAANQRSAIATQAGQQMSKSIQDAYQNATTSREHSMESWSQYMRGVQTFRNPITGDTVELSNEYGHAWAGPDNTYVLTDSGNFNPNSSLNGHWTQLDRVTR